MNMYSEDKPLSALPSGPVASGEARILAASVLKVIQANATLKQERTALLRYLREVTDEVLITGSVTTSPSQQTSDTRETGKRAYTSPLVAQSIPQASAPIRMRMEERDGDIEVVVGSDRGDGVNVRRQSFESTREERQRKLAALKRPPHSSPVVPIPSDNRRWTDEGSVSVPRSQHTSRSSSACSSPHLSQGSNQRDTPRSRTLQPPQPPSSERRSPHVTQTNKTLVPQEHFDAQSSPGSARESSIPRKERSDSETKQQSLAFDSKVDRNINVGKTFAQWDACLDKSLDLSNCHREKLGTILAMGPRRRTLEGVQ